MMASEWVMQKCAAARREGITLGLVVGCVVGIGIMLAVHMALSMRADAIHESAQASIREANVILSGDRGSTLAANVRECRALVETVSEEKYEVVRDYQRQIDELQGRAK